MAQSESRTNLVCDNENSDSSEWSSDNENHETNNFKSDSKVQICNAITVKDTNSLVSKAAKRKRVVSVSLPHCRYDVIRRIVQKFGYKEVGENENWNIYWTDLSITVERCKEMKRFQKINHFPGMLEICRKDLLARNLNRMLRLFPRDYNFFPRTWCFPADLGEAINYSKLRKNKTFILKPDAGSQGRGIFLTKSLKDIRPCDRGICQVYITKPCLIDDYKFDLRIYALVTSCDPLRIYVFHEGLVRFATTKYKEPNGVNIANVFMHLTNYAVNKHSRTYNVDSEGGSKRKLSWLYAYLKNLNYDVDSIWKRMEDVIIKTVISAYPVLKHSYAACFPSHNIIPACCELLGIDILLDKRMNPQVLEVNHSPSFHTDTLIDCEVKEALLTDMFAMMNLEKCDKRKVMREERKRVRERLIHGVNKEHPFNDTKCFDQYFEDEFKNRGRFKLIYPQVDSEQIYSKFFEQGLNTLYSDTAASRAREAAQNALRDEMQLRAKLEAAKRVAPIVRKRNSDISDIFSQRLNSKLSNPVSSVPTTQRGDDLSWNSFEPQSIIETEERERLKRLSQRDYLVRSSGILEHVYFSLKRNKVIRPTDEKKYCIFEKIKNVSEVIKGDMQSGKPTISDMIEGITSLNKDGPDIVPLQPDIVTLLKSRPIDGHELDKENNADKFYKIGIGTKV